MNRRALGFWVLLACLLLVIGLLAGPGARSGEPLDPDATDQLGTAALMELLSDFGAGIERGRMPDDDTSVTLMLVDRLDAEQLGALDAWIDDGGVLVVADPGSAYAPTGGAFLPDASATVVEGRLAAGDCDLPVLAGLVLEADRFLVFPPDPAPPAEGRPPFTVDSSCFPGPGPNGSGYLQVSEQGRGRVIALGGALPLTNRYLDEGDNAVLAVELLTGGGAGGPVVVLYEPLFTAGSRSLLDLVPSGLRWSVWQFALAAALYIWWRARRFGSPVSEPQPVELPASLLVRATSELRRRSGAEAEASTVLRDHLELRLRRELKVAPEVQQRDLIGQVAVFAGLDPALVGRALAGPPAVTGPELAALVADVDTVQRQLAAIAGANGVVPVGPHSSADPLSTWGNREPAPGPSPSVPVGTAGEQT